MKLELIGEEKIFIKAGNTNTNRKFKKKMTEPLMNFSHTLGLCGTPGSGKTVAFESLLTAPNVKGVRQSYLGQFDTVCFVSPSIDNIKNPKIKKLKHKYDSLTTDVLNQVEEIAIENHDKEQHTLLILDDCASNLKALGIVAKLNQMFMNYRQMSLSIWVVSQKYTAISPTVRQCIKTWFLFSLDDALEYESIQKASMLSIPQFKMLYSKTFDTGMESRHNFIIMDKSREIQNRIRYFIKFQEVNFIIEEGDDIPLICNQIKEKNDDVVYNASEKEEKISGESKTTSKRHRSCA